MCGRYTLTQPEAIVEELCEVGDVEVLQPLQPRYNIAPSQAVPIVRPRRDTGTWAVANVRWGLVPLWAKDPAIGNRMINARAETAASKPAFRHSFAHRRCLVLADGFYEWQPATGAKQPFHIRRPDGRGLLLAGLWARWEKGEQPLDTFTILTTEANATLRPIHHRMPVILDHPAAATWLDPVAERHDLAPLLVAARDDLLQPRPVSREVNRPANDRPSLIEPIDR